MAKRPYLPFPSPDEPGVMLVPLTRGLYAKIDADDYAIIAPYRWFAENVNPRNESPLTYARTNRSGGKKMYLHRLLMGAQKGVQIDHVRIEDTLDCRRSNLRVASHGQNMQNRSSIVGSSSRFKGVHWLKSAGKWRATITAQGRRRNLGRFTDEIEAAKAYDAAARELHGDFARLNFP